MTSPQLYLASQSPRRAQLLQQIGIEFVTLVVAVDESPLPGEVPEAYVRRLAAAKAKAGWQQVRAGAGEPLPVIGSDTTVVLEGGILGKPVDREDALRMLRALSGRCHQVMTAVSLVADDYQQAVVSISDVCFRELSIAECAAYWDTGEPADKAGGYAIQGRGAVFVSELRGSFSGVVGLPLMETSQMLNAYWHRGAG